MQPELEQLSALATAPESAEPVLPETVLAQIAARQVLVEPLASVAAELVLQPAFAVFVSVLFAVLVAV